MFNIFLLLYYLMGARGLHDARIMEIAAVLVRSRNFFFNRARRKGQGFIWQINVCKCFRRNCVRV